MFTPWDTQYEGIKLAIEHDLVPVVYGDVVFDLELGGTILSTEDLFQSLVQPLCPQQMPDCRSGCRGLWRSGGNHRADYTWKL